MSRRWPVLIALVLVAAACGGSGDSRATTQAPAGASDGGGEEPTAQASRARLKRIGTFSAPVHVTAPRGDRKRVFVVEQAGVIRVLVRGRRLARPFLDIRSRVRAGGEQGLLSMAFAPDYARSGRFYVYFTDTSGDSRVVEYRRASANRAKAGSARQVLFQEQPESNHNGGQIAFGPDDMLYVGFGDGGGAGDRHGPRGNGQNLGTWLGKILRIDPRRRARQPYTVPSDNPFAGRSGARPEIWAYGLRNPWRFSFDRRKGDLVIAAVGPSAIEEVNFAPRGTGAGANYGWRPFEGTRRYASGESAPGHVEPVHERTHDSGWCSITGGVVVRDRRLGALYGRYLFGDFCAPRIVSGKLDRPRMRAVRDTSMRVPQLSSFGEDGRGRVYAMSLGGAVYRLVAR